MTISTRSIPYPRPPAQSRGMGPIDRLAAELSYLRHGVSWLHPSFACCDRILERASTIGCDCCDSLHQCHNGCVKIPHLAFDIPNGVEQLGILLTSLSFDGRYSTAYFLGISEAKIMSFILTSLIVSYSSHHRLGFIVFNCFSRVEAFSNRIHERERTAAKTLAFPRAACIRTRLGIHDLASLTRELQNRITTRDCRFLPLSCLLSGNRSSVLWFRSHYIGRACQP
ncbi:hypothetical protein F5B18DRAFT_474443 [Nemania serpens]|nr:hypothetical protein F5B18DRAFT_474443 [Nemania serpens]